MVGGSSSGKIGSRAWESEWIRWWALRFERRAMRVRASMSGGVEIGMGDGGMGGMKRDDEE